MAPPVTCTCGSCKKCKQRIYMRGWYERQNAGKRRAISRRVYEAAVRAGRQNAKPGPKRAARNATQSMTKKPCAHCGATSGVQAHHPDYSKPRSVVWLCARCHGRVHRS